MADGVWKAVYPKVFGSSHQLMLNNKFFDLRSSVVSHLKNAIDPTLFALVQNR